MTKRKLRIMISILVAMLFAQTFYTQAIIIGKQEWTTKNLDVSTFRNGDPIPESKTDGEWKAHGQAGEATWCYYKNDPSNKKKYGKLYNWYAVSDPRGLAPKGWHIPTDADWIELMNYLGGQEKAGFKMKSKEGWSFDGNGTNSSGLSLFPGGYRGGDGAFFNLEHSGQWWSSSEHDIARAWYCSLGCMDGYVNINKDPKENGFSVRCLRD